MARLQPWYKTVAPRSDLREGKPLDASEFAVHLDHVKEGSATDDYTFPDRFFDRTYLTDSLTSFAAQVVRRLSGNRVETSAVYNMATQFGGGKTHALTLLYHLATNGPVANSWSGVSSILTRAGVTEVPKAEVAVFVGIRFDAITGRGGADGTPHRRTPWGDFAFQLGGAEAYEKVAAHDEAGEAPGGDVILDFLSKDKPSLILMDEVINYISRYRGTGWGAQLYPEPLGRGARPKQRCVGRIHPPVHRRNEPGGPPGLRAASKNA